VKVRLYSNKLLDYVVSFPFPFPVLNHHSSLCSANRPQSAQQIRPQQTHQSQQQGNVPFIPQNTPQNFETAQYFTSTLDMNAAAKQMAAMSAAGVQRQMANVNGRSSASVSGVSPGSYLGGMSSSYNQPGSFTGPPHDTTNSMQFNPTASSGQSNTQGIYPAQQTTNAPPNPSLNAPMSHPNFTPSDVAKHRQRTFLTGLAGAHARVPLPPALTGSPYPPNYDPTNSQWKYLDCPPGQPGVIRLGGKDIDLLRLWQMVTQLGGSQKVCLFVFY
jgi:SWI/SNF chromatin-remodeling complex subunit SWI1